MNIVFFQNCISPHQMPYINILPEFDEINEVHIIVPEADMETRKVMGWNSETYVSNSNLNIIINANDEVIINLFEKFKHTETWCLFSGINSFPYVTHYFKLSLKYDVKRGIITEPPLIYNHPLWQHAIRFAIKDWRYTKYISKIFVMGDDFLNYYKLWSKKWDVIPFIYCTEWKSRKDQLNNETDKLKLLFVGSLSHRKNVQLLFKAINMFNEKEQEKIEIGIIGDGEEKGKLIQLSTNKKYNTQFYGTIAMNKVSEIMQEYDILCLPSLHDGWGAVVNEAITLGLFAICSDTCGCKYLIKKSNYTCGNIFINNNAIDLKGKIQDCILAKDEIKKCINKRIDWAQKNIKSNIVAQYFIDNLKK